ncbi:cation efflux protein [Mycotypha africana]|uniref:cation efflux protein n=1 Tax=Mycotypha africana TaxID=64632 RepID=UPI0023001026|nr:cation efflux protein [Mycotypha africana]KAI8967736.1 cation efflux protein [Mycotypha africana]
MSPSTFNETMSAERTPLLNGGGGGQQQLLGNSGSVVSYTIPQENCSNNNLKDRQQAKSTKRRLWFAVGLACAFFVTELVAGYFANSLALMSDAFHLLSDVASFIVALVAIYLAEKPATKKHTFGFHRAEVIAALVSVLTIWILTGFLLHEAIQRLKKPEVIDAKLMCITATIGVAVNVVLAYVLGGHGHSHDGHSHEHNHNTNHGHDEETHIAHHANGGQHEHNHGEPATAPPRKEANINLRAAALHVLGDLLASVGVLVSSIILLFKPHLTFVDPMCTFIFSILVLYTTYHLVKDSLAVLMEGVPGNIHPDLIEKSLLGLPGVIAVHDLHVWTLSPGKYSLTAHVKIDAQNGNYDEILSKGQHIVCDIYGVHHSTLQIESDNTLFTSHCNPELCASR